MNLKFKVFHKNMFSTKEVVFLDALASLDFTLVSQSVSVSHKSLGAQNHVILNSC